MEVLLKGWVTCVGGRLDVCTPIKVYSRNYHTCAIADRIPFHGDIPWLVNTLVTT